MNTMKKSVSGARMLIVLLFASLGCKAQQSDYDLDHPSTTIKLPHKVNEISGITYTQEFVYAIDDEHGDVYKIELKQDPKIENWSYGKNKDYEDVVLVQGRIYSLNSKGHIVSFDEEFPIKKTNKADLDLKGKNEFESLYYDPSLNKLIVLCKECSVDDKDENSAWAFDLSTHSFDKNPVYKIKRKDIEKVYGKKIGRFKPSAATINPVTQELYVLSSVNSILVIIKNNEVKQVLKLNPDLFNQPEGICFSPSGDLLISNESGKKQAATILIFKRK
jgi:sugar lactone lactonase YvrE